MTKASPEQRIGSGSCTICGGTEFGPGPGGRMSATGVAPACSTCASLERHRTNRSVFSRLAQLGFGTMSVLQFSEDRSVEADWFDRFELSVYGGENSLDLQKIDRPAATYDIVICNHVLEHVAYDNAAVAELARVCRDDGFVYLTFPSPATRTETRDWGYPDDRVHGHYREYGSDVMSRLFQRHLPWLWVISLDTSDPVTDARDISFFVARTSRAVARLLDVLDEATVRQVGSA